MQKASRLKRELQMLSTEPPPGITCWQTEERTDDLRARTCSQAFSTYNKSPRTHDELSMSSSYLIVSYCLRTEIVGGTDTPYEGGLFSLEINVPDRYVFST